MSAIVLADRIAAGHGVRVPTIQWLPEHRFTVRFAFFFDPMPPMDRLPVIAQAVIDGLVAADPRCQPNTDVFIFFSRYGTEVATWQAGQLLAIPGPLPPPIS